MKTAWIAVLLALCAGWMGVTSASEGDAQDSIWPRIADGMRIVDPEQPDTVMWARRYARQPAAFATMLARSEPFLWYIVEAVELREMPLELALLPAVESGFDPKARSAAKARGLWQFVPWTGRALGLSHTSNYDARHDPVASTRAALGYLQDLNERFGDWLLAVAAYNVGDTRLAAALRRQEGRQFWDLEDLPRETREHVPRLLGVALLIKQPERFGVVLPEIANRQAAELVRLPKAVNLEQAALDAGVDSALMEHYNPGLKDAANSSGKKVVLLPPEEARRLRDVLAAGSYPPQPLAQTVEHVVRPGDSLWSIARHYQVSVRELRSWNDLGSKGVLRPGKRLQLRVES